MTVLLCAVLELSHRFLQLLAEEPRKASAMAVSSTSRVEQFSSPHAESCLPFEARAKDRVNKQTSHKKLGVVDVFTDILCFSTTIFFLKLLW